MPQTIAIVLTAVLAAAIVLAAVLAAALAALLVQRRTIGKLRRQRNRWIGAHARLQQRQPMTAPPGPYSPVWTDVPPPVPCPECGEHPHSGGTCLDCPICFPRPGGGL